MTIATNDHAEDAVIGTLIGFPGKADVNAIRTILKPEHFFRSDYAEIYRSYLDICDSGYRPSAESLKSILGESFSDTIKRFSDAADPRIANLKLHAEQVVEAWKRREIMRLHSKAIEHLEGGDHSADAIQAKYNAAVQGIDAVDLNKHVHEVGDLFDEYTDAIGTQATGRSSVSTGIEELDTHYGNMRAGQLVVIAAQTSMGKTQFAMQIAKHVSSVHKRQVLLLTLEMDRIEVMHRIVSEMADVSPVNLDAGRLSNAQRKRAVAALSEITSQWQLTILDPPSTDVPSLQAIARLWKTKHKNAGLVIVDYLQLLDPENARQSRNEQVTAMSRGLKKLARELELPVMALAQLNREADKQKGPPRLSHLRESGAIEQDANRVIFLHRPNFEDEEGVRHTTPSEEANIIVAKNRGGPIGRMSVVYKQCVGFEQQPVHRVQEFDDFNNAERQGV